MQQPLFSSHFCLQYWQWREQQPKSMRQTHKTGDKCFIDYAGLTVDFIGPDTDKIRSTQFF